jgi:hypothetical protein
MATEHLIRITTLIPRKKGMSQEDFYKHWTQIHAPLCTDFMMRHGVIEYRQVGLEKCRRYFVRYLLTLI